MDLTAARETIQTVGALVALVVGGINGATTWSRHRRENTHARTELHFWRSSHRLEGADLDGRLVARLWVGRRRFYLVHAWQRVGDWGTEMRPPGQHEATWLEAGQSLELTGRYVSQLVDAEAANEEFGDKAMSKRARSSVEVSFECGEGEKHIAKLSWSETRALKSLLRDLDRAATENGAA